MQIILQRLENSIVNLPLQIAIFEGSVVEGSERQRNFLGMPRLKGYYIPCMWPKKLEHLLNKVLGNGAVVVKNAGNGTVIVKNAGIGGSDSSIGWTVLEYDLWSDPDYKLSDIDIFITSFTSNDG